MLYHALDPNASWSGGAYNLVPSARTVSKGYIRTEELSTRTDLVAVKAQYPGWNIAAFSVTDARSAGYILMLNPMDSSHVLLYDKNDPDKRASGTIAQKLANAAQVI
jgi:hypothetical protein